MENVIVVVIVGLAVAYLVKRCLGVFRPGKQNTCGCGCADCVQTSSCGPDAALQPRDSDGKHSQCLSPADEGSA